MKTIKRLSVYTSVRPQDSLFEFQDDEPTHVRRLTDRFRACEANREQFPGGRPRETVLWLRQLLQQGFLLCRTILQQLTNLPRM
ncbi:hypothetical protein E4U56_005964 [Claviceps arundinis]|uniref:Uncharacterized protein n=1 Tax=Claviceps arundinis TaxID=1623583 RepID=A0A9P7MXT7_9HYPO|nr:hypothetical protein E4U56_005964 [Claviceps arundinis]